MNIQIMVSFWGGGGGVEDSNNGILLGFEDLNFQLISSLFCSGSHIRRGIYTLHCRGHVDGAAQQGLRCDHLRRRGS